MDFLKKIDRKYYSAMGSILFLTGIIVIGILILKTNDTISISDGDGALFVSEYESLNNELVDGEKKYPKVNITFKDIKYINVDELLTKLTKGSGMDGTFAVYIGYAECIYCRSAIQVLVDTARESKIDKIYYLDISEIWDIKEINFNGDVIVKQEANPRYWDLVNRLGDEFFEDYILYDKDGNEINMKEKRIISPLVLFVVDGYVISYNAGTLFSQTDPYTPLDDDQIRGLSEIYGYGLRDVVEGINIYKRAELEKQTS